jgi:hypothetical protein
MELQAKRAKAVMVSHELGHQNKACKAEELFY